MAEAKPCPGADNLCHPGEESPAGGGQGAPSAGRAACGIVPHGNTQQDGASQTNPGTVMFGGNFPLEANRLHTGRDECVELLCCSKGKGK